MTTCEKDKIIIIINNRLCELTHITVSTLACSDKSHMFYSTGARHKRDTATKNNTVT